MGKYIESKRLTNKITSDGLYRFKVIVSVHGKNTHSETYSIDARDLPFARKLGYLSGNKEYEEYLDWKPLNNLGDSLQGGIKQVQEYTYDDKYVYAHTKDRVYSLPKYLFKNNKDVKYILFGRREKDK